jgi:hypothetical protein
MKRWLPALWLGAWLGCGGAAEEAEDLGRDARPIVNGEPTTGEPAVVFLEMGCSGTLVTPKTVLSACHCFQGVSGNPGVFFGSDVDQGGTWIDSVHHAVFPGGCSGDGDLAMLTLAEPGPAQPVPINDRDLAPYVGSQVRVVGFGVTGENAQDLGLKRKGTSVLGQLEPGVMFCQASSPSGTCYGDSGGPNFMTIDGKEYVAGTTSYGTDACGSGWDASARTDAHYDWLKQYIDSQDPGGCGPDGSCAAGCAEPDPDCPCAPDGLCTAVCPTPTSDPDCGGELDCISDGVCSHDCPLLDFDCCIADGACYDSCGQLDPDCAITGEGGGDGEPGGPAAASDDDDDDEPAGCSAAGGASGAWWPLFGLVGLWRCYCRES